MKNLMPAFLVVFVGCTQGVQHKAAPSPSPSPSPIHGVYKFKFNQKVRSTGGSFWEGCIGKTYGARYADLGPIYYVNLSSCPLGNPGKREIYAGEEYFEAVK